MCVHCHMVGGHMTTLGTFKFTFWSWRSFAELPWKWVQIALICCVLGHLLVLELIFKGWEGLPCQFQRTVYWHCECDKLCSNARFKLLAACCSWTRGRKANGPCLIPDDQASICICESFIESWKCLDNCWCKIQAWSKTYKNVWR